MRSQLEALQKLRIDYGELYCQLRGIGPTGGFCVDNTAGVGGNERVDEPACATLAQVMSGKSVLDLGCGMGGYGKCLANSNRGIGWVGYDGSEGIEKATGKLGFLAAHST
jgi:2-polyprenyl-3-methyl-5-hydroxy-6-metoxy-1,4-benzoquinol methylase